MSTTPSEAAIRGKRSGKGSRSAPPTQEDVQNVKGPHHVEIVGEQGKGKTSYSRTFRDRAGAHREAVAQRRTGHSATVIAGRAPAESVPGSVPGSETPDQKATRKAASAASTKAMTPCKCGCGREVRHLYAQGHDARHVSQLAQGYRSVVQGDSTEHEVAVERKQALAEVAFSERLTSKLRRSIELIDAKAAKSEAA